MADVIRFRCPDGQEFAWHGSMADLRKAHPDAAVLGVLVLDDLGQGTWEPYQAGAKVKSAVDDEPSAGAKAKAEKKAAAERAE